MNPPVRRLFLVHMVFRRPLSEGEIVRVAQGLDEAGAGPPLIGANCAVDPLADPHNPLKPPGPCGVMITHMFGPSAQAVHVAADVAADGLPLRHVRVTRLMRIAHEKPEASG